MPALQCSAFGLKWMIVRYVAIATPRSASGSVTHSTQAGAGSTVRLAGDVGSDAADMSRNLELEPERVGGCLHAR